MVPAKNMKECIITAIIQGNTKGQEFDGIRFHGASEKYERVHYHCHYAGKYKGTAHIISNLRYKIPKKTNLVFHNMSNYDYHFIIKQLVEEFKRQFKWLGKNAEQYITFSMRIEKHEHLTAIKYKIRFINSVKIFCQLSVKSEGKLCRRSALR